MRTTVVVLGIALAGCSQAGPDATSDNRDSAIAVNEAESPAENPSEPATATSEPIVAGKPPRSTHPCSVQDGDAVAVEAMRAIGTEPFWNARTDGRCVTYSTPENQAGTRIWAKAELAGGRSVWTGALHGKPFVLAISAAETCSDGMSDTVYAYAAELKVGGETRRGCAERI